VIVSTDALVSFARDVLVAAGASPDDAQEVAGHLVRAEASGRESHGVRTLGEHAEALRSGLYDTSAEVERVADHGAVVVLDGHLGLGQVTARAALDLAAERAREHGIACVLARRAGNIGRLGDYTEALAEQGLASLLLVAGQHAPIAPWGGADGRLPNNSLSLGFPGDPDAVVIDVALGAAAVRKVRLAQARAESIPEGWLVDASGAPTTKPEALDRGGRLLPMGGHKGYGLAVLVDLLAGVLSGSGGAGSDTRPPGNVFTLIAIEVERLVSRDEAFAQLAAFREYVTSSPALPGFAAVLLPGERSAAARRRAEAEGGELDEPTWVALQELAVAASVPLPPGLPLH
jgi:uncharacterized oxidoreductase